MCTVCVLCVQVALISAWPVATEDTLLTCCGGSPHTLSVLLAVGASVWRPVDGPNNNNCNF